MTAQRPSLVVVDDEQGILDVVSRFGRRAGFDVIACSGGREAIAQLQTRSADIAMVDLRMPDIGGLDVIRAIREIDPHCQAVLMTGFATVDTAVEAIKLGAMDYLSKPLDFARLEQLLASVKEEIERRRNLLAMESDVARHLEFCGMIGRGPVMHELFGMIRRLAPHVRTALITGETGTGKELVARALHQTGPRRERRFVTVNCSAVVETLFESELFGHVRGAFTGATDHKPGLFELADGGTILLDEIGELPPSVQAKLLRVLELGEVHRVGSLEPKRVNVHVLAATNRDLRAEVTAGRFRSDLYYRLNIVEVKLPALRNRREDIPYLTAAFVRQTSERLQKPVAGLTPGAERVLAAASWEGNVRELRNVIERATILAPGPFIETKHLPPVLTDEPPVPQQPQLALAPGTTVEEAERRLIVMTLAHTRDNKTRAAEILGISLKTLHNKLNKLRLRPKKTEEPR
jgi:DNA-binding NtrC family response regulator